MEVIFFCNYIIGLKIISKMPVILAISNGLLLEANWAIKLIDSEYICMLNIKHSLFFPIAQILLVFSQI